MPSLRNLFIAALAALFAPALFALDLQNPTPASSAVPGTLNYVEGAATIDGHFLAASSVGSVTLQPGQEIATSQGRVEVLLTPGVFLRLDHNSAAKMTSSDLLNTVVNVDRGQAAVEVDQIFRENDLHVVENNVPVQLLKPGFYEFNAARGTVLVFSGEAAALRPSGRFTTIKAHHELNVAEGAQKKTVSFDENAQEQSGLYRWSSLRSDYLAEANQEIAGEYGMGYAPGWYWDPWMWDYTFLGPYPFYSPFGWGFYPFGWGGWGLWGGGGFYGGYGHPGPHGRVPLARGGFDGGFRAGGSMGGFHGGGFGGFHGGGGGFHGGR
ncbi:MAG TPA: hypothetical protein VMD92_08630 [Acidobacteriaceae bacterium]|nr:hypothetical protein [Acidobacteriaceae bacterium]